MKKILIALLAIGLLSGCGSNLSPDEKKIKAVIQKEIDRMKSCASQNNGTNYSSEFEDFLELEKAHCKLNIAIANKMKIVDIIILDTTATVTIEVREFNKELFFVFFTELYSKHELYSRDMTEEQEVRIITDSLKKMNVEDFLSKGTTIKTVTLSFKKGEWTITDGADFLKFSLFKSQPHHFSFY